MKQTANTVVIPKHVGLIIDGNRRWARAQGKPSLQGHLRGYQAIKEVTLELFDQGVEFVSAYVFSTENWRRGEEEVSYLMNMAVTAAAQDLDSFLRQDIRVLFLGTKEGLSKKLIKTIEECEEKSAHCTRGVFAPCFNYGGQQEIADACRRLVEIGTPAEHITPELIREHLYQPGIPDVDLIVRTSGEQRLSNFMLWRAGYSEFLFLDKLWPDMTKQDVSTILEAYGRRQRRFGGN